jgi:hypothetical protein
MLTQTAQLLTANRDRIEAIARELSVYGLAISTPHMHTEKNESIELPSGFVAFEKNLNITFMEGNRLPGSSIPVGWRWKNDKLEVWAACCGEGEGDGDDGDGWLSR